MSLKKVVIQGNRIQDAVESRGHRAGANVAFKNAWVLDALPNCVWEIHSTSNNNTSSTTAAAATSSSSRMSDKDIAAMKKKYGI